MIERGPNSRSGLWSRAGRLVSTSTLVWLFSGCIGGAFYQEVPLGQLSSSQTLETDPSQEEETTGGSGSSSSSGSSTGGGGGTSLIGVLDTTFNPMGILPGFLRPSELTPAQTNLQSKLARPKLAVDSEGNQFVLYMKDPTGTYEPEKTESLLCLISADISTQECITFGNTVTGGAIPGGLHVAPDGVLYAAYLGFAVHMGAPLDDTHFKLKLLVCRILKGPLRIDPSYASSEGCYKSTADISTQSGGSVVGFHEAYSNGENHVFLSSFGDSTSYVLGAGVTGISKFPLFIALNKTGDPHPSAFATWSSGEYTHNFNIQSYSEPGGIPTMDFSGGAQITFANIVGMGFQSTGKWVAVANIYNTREGTGTGNNEFVAWRFNTDGSLDSSFGTANNDDGYLWISKASTQPATSGFSMGLSSRWGRAIVASDDRIIISGTTYLTGAGVYSMRVVAYNPSGASQTHDTGSLGAGFRYHFGDNHSNISLIDTPGEVMGEDFIYFGGNEELLDGSYRTSIFAIDAGSFSPISDFGLSGRLTITEHSNSALELGLMPAVPSLSLGKHLVVLGGDTADTGSLDPNVPLLSRYSR